MSYIAGAQHSDSQLSIRKGTTNTLEISTGDTYNPLQYVEGDGLKMVKITQANYNALTTKDDNTLYIIVG